MARARLVTPTPTSTWHGGTVARRGGKGRRGWEGGPPRAESEMAALVDPTGEAPTGEEDFQVNVPSVPDSKSGLP